MEQLFGTATAIAMMGGVLLGLAALAIVGLLIPYRLLFKRDKSPSWYFTIGALPLTCFGFAAAMFFLRAFAPNFFGKPGGITITEETKYVVDGKDVRSQRFVRDITLQKTGINGMPSESESSSQTSTDQK